MTTEEMEKVFTTLERIKTKYPKLDTEFNYHLNQAIWRIMMLAIEKENDNEIIIDLNEVTK